MVSIPRLDLDLGPWNRLVHRPLGETPYIRMYTCHNHFSITTSIVIKSQWRVSHFTKGESLSFGDRFRIDDPRPRRLNRQVLFLSRGSHIVSRGQ